jgi:radical SAM superfamily enzyme YgiQ (UPF0313 family)
MSSPLPAAPVLLLSCYELGHQPLGLAWPLAAFAQAGLPAAALDLAVQPFDDTLARAARFVAISVPMHTALRLGVQAAQRVRAVNAGAHLCFYGLYAWLNREYLLAHGAADAVIGGEFEDPLVQLARALLAGEPLEGIAGVSTSYADLPPPLTARGLPIPSRSALPSLTRYARYVDGGQPRLAGYVEATKGCQHHCRHCPIVPVYHGRLVVVPLETVLADIRQQVQAGAAHMVFGDADFLNGPTHSLRLARAMHAEHPRLTFSFTAKVEHILQHRRLFPEFAALGGTFVTSAVESLSDLVLARLDKGHTAAEILVALEILEAAGLAMQPTLVAFTPWTTLDDYLAQLDFIRAHGLEDSIAPVQLSIRLLIPPGSPLVASPDAGQWLRGLDAPNFSYRWQHPDPRMDRLHARVSALVADAEAAGEAPLVTHTRIRELAYALRGGTPPQAVPRPARRWPVPRLTEDWFC